MTTLVTVAEGSCPVAREVTRRAASSLGVPAVATWAADLPAALRRVVGSYAVVPMLLAEETALSGAPGSPGRTLGPHPLLAAAQASRLLAAGARPGRPVVLVGAGPADRLHGAASLLADTWTGPVQVATLDAGGPAPADVAGRGAVVSPYLLAPGPLHDRLRDEALAAGAAVVAEPIGAHRFVADLVARRYRAHVHATAA
ncbi:sirohydrochlorin chelatase [Nocardioides deserti]|uniref:Uncharacterized protein n=1 Tax=Nocardioides deserti TaxID=1588644 RepID=A0ABR6UC38_9ACTN|nr:hypothetical protein [Nocardioides deserti]MBC2961683.1 hypothetical protein [Nocardioides deserti]GGO76973.1 hypothetical protein GCM10012276_30990 [Nocardioides deserti]